MDILSNSQSYGSLGQLARIGSMEEEELQRKVRKHHLIINGLKGGPCEVSWEKKGVLARIFSEIMHLFSFGGSSVRTFKKNAAKNKGKSNTPGIDEVFSQFLKGIEMYRNTHKSDGPLTDLLEKKNQLELGLAYKGACRLFEKGKIKQGVMENINRFISSGAYVRDEDELSEKVNFDSEVMNLKKTTKWKYIDKEESGGINKYLIQKIEIKKFLG